MTITVQDAGANAPPSPSANLLILQLSAQSGTDLIGSLSLKLDDGYPDPVLAPIDLNFAHTAGSDEILAQINEAQAIQVTNQSPLDLQMQDYALIQAVNVTENGRADLDCRWRLGFFSLAAIPKGWRLSTRRNWRCPLR